jgi:hypothetical protein
MISGWLAPRRGGAGRLLSLWHDEVAVQLRDGLGIAVPPQGLHGECVVELRPDSPLRLASSAVPSGLRAAGRGRVEACGFVLRLRSRGPAGRPATLADVDLFLAPGSLRVGPLALVATAAGPADVEPGLDLGALSPSARVVLTGRLVLVEFLPAGREGLLSGGTPQPGSSAETPRG